MAGRGKGEGLKPVHYKALELWEEGLLSLKEIAIACKIPTESMYALFEGDSHKAGNTAHLFRSEIEKITQRSSAKVRHLVKDNKKIALGMMNDRLRVLNKKKKLSAKESSEVSRILTVLNKSTAGVEIGTFNALNLTKGMTPEELIYEFRRLSAIARNTSIGKSVSSPLRRAEGRIPPSPESGSGDEEKS